MKPSTFVDIPFTREAAMQMLKWGASPAASPYSHSQIADWCYDFLRSFREAKVNAKVEKLLEILTDVDAQWELYLANTYSTEELQNREFENEKMPIEWFNNWLQELA
ncbi:MULTISPECIES: hypothetical protein [unclassified Pseudomonas]|uniref:hypothetical protein n=1 Tax=unclassified Pseudomonas TaxID=196821 RepID=UPI00244C4F88|nr:MULTISPECIES: hypothetical protein [unclassified Pseudomonas]MDH0894472.1 hypothetical protein [Pseudomonas sp. GD03875]MDH1063233.1 hypothetical protein [Pseudomonas sp. GD03985]